MIGWIVSSKLGRAVALVAGAVVAVLTFGMVQRSKGRNDAQRERNAAYIKDRKDIDDEVSGIGATDGERIKRLHDIAERRRKD